MVMSLVILVLLIVFNVWVRYLDSQIRFLTNDKRIRHVRSDFTTGQMIVYDPNTEFMPQKIDEFNGRAIYEIRRR